MIVGLSGASGAIFGVRLLELLRELEVESHLIVSKAAAVTLAAETGFALSDLERLAYKRYPAGDIGAAIASGSFRTRGMIIAPCSIKTMSEIATGATTTLLSRAADVVLKERRRLVLAVRESPLHLGHLRSMTALAEMGAVIAPPAPAFYAGPESIDDMVTQTAARLLDLIGLNSPAIRRWPGASEPKQG
ncbi:MAG: UbiX family flavin prenyltransferase [Parvularculaceae bacterium]